MSRIVVHGSTTMRDLPLSHLRVLAAVHATGGVRSAAELLRVEHSVVSRALRDLEEILGAPLTEKRQRGQRIALTSSSELLADAVLSSIKELEKSVGSFRLPVSPRIITISTLPSIASRILVPKLREFREAHPNLELSLIVDRPRGATIDANCDLSLGMGALSGSSVGTIILGHDVAFPVMAPSLWDRLGRPTNLSALKKMRLIHDRDSEVNWELWRGEKGPVDLDTLAGSRLTMSDHALQAAELGEGVAICRAQLAAGALLTGKLVRPFGKTSISLASVWWLHEGPRAKQNKNVKKVRDFLIKSWANRDVFD